MKAFLRKASAHLMMLIPVWLVGLYSYIAYKRCHNHFSELVNAIGFWNDFITVLSMWSTWFFVGFGIVLFVVYISTYPKSNGNPVTFVPWSIIGFFVMGLALIAHTGIPTPVSEPSKKLPIEDPHIFAAKQIIDDFQNSLEKTGIGPDVDIKERDVKLKLITLNLSDEVVEKVYSDYYIPLINFRQSLLADSIEAIRQKKAVRSDSTFKLALHLLKNGYLPKDEIVSALKLPTVAAEGKGVPGVGEISTDSLRARQSFNNMLSAAIYDVVDYGDPSVLRSYDFGPANVTQRTIVQALPDQKTRDALLEFLKNPQDFYKYKSLRKTFLTNLVFNKAVSGPITDTVNFRLVFWGDVGRSFQTKKYFIREETFKIGQRLVSEGILTAKELSELTRVVEAASNGVVSEILSKEFFPIEIRTHFKNALVG